MKHLFLLLFSSLILGQSIAQNKLDEKRIKDFRKMEWGKSIDELSTNGELVFIETAKEKDGTHYVLADENLVIGNVLLTNIEYVFSKKDDKFYKVILTGRKADVEQMKFIVDYKYGTHSNENVTDNNVVKEWLVSNVKIMLNDFAYNKFTLVIESDWEAVEAYRKNTNVSDF